MSAFPLLFDLGTPKPTSRQIADTVKAGGTAALTEAERRADQARYPGNHLPLRVEPREGYAVRLDAEPLSWLHARLPLLLRAALPLAVRNGRRRRVRFRHSREEEFRRGTRAQLARPSWKGDYIAVGTATDCYQPIEGHYKLTRGSLEALVRARNPAGVITKGPMVVRDRDLLADLSRVASCTVYMSVPTVDEDVWRQLEPGTAHPLQRLRAVRELVDAGINAGVLMNPIVPGFSSSRDKLERTMKAVADHGARFVGCNVMFLEDGTRSHFMKFIERDFPSMLPRFEKLYEKKYAPSEYRKQVQGMIRVLQDRYRLSKRKDADAEHQSAATTPESEQVGFAW